MLRFNLKRKMQKIVKMKQFNLTRKNVKIRNNTFIENETFFGNFQALCGNAEIVRIGDEQKQG